jgi:hypothetical protein
MREQTYAVLGERFDTFAGSLAENAGQITNELQTIGSQIASETQQTSEFDYIMTAMKNPKTDPK